MADSTFTDQAIDRIRNIHHDDLENVSKAFERWRTIVETTKRERTLIESFVLTYKCEEWNIWSEASFCITFSMAESKDVEQRLWKHMRQDAQVVLFQSEAGVIGTTSDLSQIVHQENYNSRLPMNTALATHLRIPSLPGVNIKVLAWDWTISFNDFRNSFSIPENNIIKCLLILTTYKKSSKNTSEQKDDFVLFLQTTQNEDFAVGGCFIDEFLGDSEKDVLTKYIIFYGEKVEAASIVLKQEVNTKEKIESHVDELKSVCPKTEQGVLFVFSCCNRNKPSMQPKAHKELTKWEGEALLKHFPATPVIGCYGYGEFGRKFPEDQSSNRVSKRIKRSNIWEYSFSTSIVYVGFKK